jgi:hypothetical protein
VNTFESFVEFVKALGELEELIDYMLGGPRCPGLTVRVQKHE